MSFIIINILWNHISLYHYNVGQMCNSMTGVLHNALCILEKSSHELSCSVVETQVEQ